MELAYLPSPAHSAVHLGPLPLRGYSMMVLLGVVAGLWWGGRRWAARGGQRGTVLDIAMWALPFGIVGARLYHVLTSSGPYFGTGGDPVKALYVWDGGIGIWGAIAGGAAGAWIGCRRHGVPLPAYADAVAPGLALGQAIGRWGNWFNQELFGRPTTLPWGLRITPGHDGYIPGHATYHPTFLYESLWCLGVAALVAWADRRHRLDHGRAFALYAASYTAGRFWIEYLRIDDAHHILGLRLNDWTSLLVFTAATAYFVLSARRRDASPLRGRSPAEAAAGRASDTSAPRLRTHTLGSGVGTAAVALPDVAPFLDGDSGDDHAVDRVGPGKRR